MFAVIKTGGKQYKVSSNENIFCQEKFCPEQVPSFFVKELEHITLKI